MATHEAFHNRIDGSGNVQFGDTLTIYNHYLSRPVEDFDESVLNSLAFPEMLDRRSNTSEPHRKTCQWILEHEAYNDWVESPRGLLWVKGDPGSGKSTLMKYVYNKLRNTFEEVENLIIEFFFHARGTELQKTFNGMLRSLLYQLFRGDPEAKLYFLQAYKEKRSVAGKSEIIWSEGELRKLFLDSVLSVSRKRQLTIIVDALDEAGELPARKIITYLHNLSDEISTAHGTGKICVSCRPYPVTSIFPGRMIQVDQCNRHDIQLYVQDSVHLDQVVGSESTDFSAWQEVKKQVVSRASGSFQWACIVTDWVVEHIADGESPRSVRKLLEQVPQELEDVYNHILLKVIKPQNRARAFTLFQWTCLAERPLKLSEMRYAIATTLFPIAETPVAFENMSDFVENNYQMRNSVRTWSGGLVEVQPSKKRGLYIQAIHQTVVEYMLSQGIALLASLQTGFWKSLKECDVIDESHAALFRGCLNYTRSLRFYGDPEILINRWGHLSGVPDSVPGDTFRFLQYSTENALSHARNSSQRYLCNNETDIIQVMTNEWLPFCRLEIGEGKPPSLLFAASSAGLLSLSRTLLEGKVATETRSIYGKTAIHIAAEYGQIEVVSELVQSGANVNVRCRHRKTPLHYTADAEILRVLINGGASVHVKDNKGLSPLHSAAEYGNERSIFVLVQNGADVNARSNDGDTPLHSACDSDRLSSVQALLERGADIHARNNRGATSLHSVQSPSVLTLLLKYGANIHQKDNDGQTPLHAAAEGHLRAIYFGWKPVIAKLLENGADVNAESRNGETPLHVAARSFEKGTLVTLLKNGADFNALSRSGETALHMAAASGFVRGVEQLLKKGIDVNCRTYSGDTALHLAVLNTHSAVVAKLLQYKADATARNKRNRTPLLNAVVSASTDFVELFLDSNLFDEIEIREVEIQEVDFRKDEPAEEINNIYTDLLTDHSSCYSSFLPYPSKSSSITDPQEEDITCTKRSKKVIAQGIYASSQCDMVLLLLSPNYIMDPELCCYGLMIAMRKGKSTAVAELLSISREISLLGPAAGETLIAAAQHGFPQVVQKLLKDGIDVDIRAGDDETARQLYHAIYHIKGIPIDMSSLERWSDGMFERIIRGEGKDFWETLASVSRKSHSRYGSQNWALQAAVAAGHLEVVDLLLDAGADVNTTGGRYGHVLFAASHNGHKELFQMLRDRGASLNVLRKRSIVTVIR